MADDKTPAKAPAVVAELGRPETPEETAARKARSTRLYYRRKTIRNLVASLVVSLVGVAVIVAIVPRNDTVIEHVIDYASVAQEAQTAYPQHLVVPRVPEGWTSNQAEIRVGQDGVTEWYIGFLVPDAAGRPTAYAGVSEVLDGNPTWLVERLKKRQPTGEANVGGLTWQEYDYTSLPSDQTGNLAYSLVYQANGTIYIVYGTGSKDAVQALAAAVAADIR